MSDLYYDGGGGGGSGFSFDSGSLGGGGSIDPTAPIGYVANSDPKYNSDYFSQNPNSINPYSPTYTFKVPVTFYTTVGYNNGMPIIKPVTRYNVYTDANPAYTDFENKATEYQNNFYAEQTATHNDSLSTSKQAFTNEYKQYHNGTIQNDTQKLADLKAQYDTLVYQDEITKYLNRVADTNNVAQEEKLKQEIGDLENKLSDEAYKYAKAKQLEEIKQSQEFSNDGLFGTPFVPLTDPCFGRGACAPNGSYGYTQQQATEFSNFLFTASVFEWLAGGTYLNASMAGGDMNAPYIPNDYYSMGIGYKSQGTDMAQGLKDNAPYGAMAGGLGYGLNSSESSPYYPLQL